ncbi:hypothetical protein UAW_00623 [Enterococcus haemoperoxidus ATCC BAA-382]|uniref:Uncharacterized protein n=1 Tax=Enterococcus haemoperoxidus ATCC BAA-382 TaxID=1158608 RepID=R2T3B5_9ENTE|nr:hypothetical protein [Enterococcus haemoperoxidus]EOH99471.1 hypothetical protein UAW_00623 [Enterococcus haemoperoxidus ATCC BAA-382]EOT62788.1 hypothetical protein I583_01789 [Enterococcus haemoperoxidus ATCC BAA-382]OJG48971.1 hypothetical protein RV06_GL002035 [Enterococcus haemoperoxidus]
MEKKYQLTKESIEIDGHKLYRIQAIREFSVVEKGEYGGFIESEKNLNQYDDSWVSKDAKVYEQAYVKDYGEVNQEAVVKGNGIIEKFGKVFNKAVVDEFACVTGNAQVIQNASITGCAVITDAVVISGDAQIFGDVKVTGVMHIGGTAVISSLDDYFSISSIDESILIIAKGREQEIWAYRTGLSTIPLSEYKKQVSSLEFELVLKILSLKGWI